jgi:hypothetical protein
VAFIHQADSRPLVESWLSEAAATLTNEGWQGVLDAESSEVPEIQLPDKHQVGMSLMLSFPARLASGFKTLAPWLSDHRLAESLGDWAADWVTAGADAAYLTRGMATFKLPAQQIHEQLARGPASSLVLASADSGHARSVKFEVWGRVLVQIRDVDSCWEDRLSELREVMLTYARVCSYAMIRHAKLPAASAIDLLDVLPPRLPGGGQAPRQYFRYRSDLDGQHVPDACGVQLLTDKHMQEVHDLSRWSTEQISPSRYLVSAVDLAAWFERDEPEERALEQARQDFDGAILTKQRLREIDQA